MKLSEYNELTRALGYQHETIEKEDEILLIPGRVSQKQEFKNGDYKKILKSFKRLDKDISCEENCREFSFTT